jgi:acyl-CoA thioesterase I
MIIKPNDVILFTGDSITDCGRTAPGGPELGLGYPFLAAAQIQAQVASPSLKIYNRGIGGNRVYDLEGRLESDLIALKPTILSILIGVNDTWRRFDSNTVSTTENFKAAYHNILSRVKKDLPETQIILLEPFILPYPEDRKAWRVDLDPKITAVRELVNEFETEFIPLDGMFAEATTRAPANYWLGDGVHPTAAGHSLISDAWLDHAQIA